MTEEGVGRIARGLFRALLVFLGGVAGYQIKEYIQELGLWPFTTIITSLSGTASFILVFAGLGYLLTPLFLKWLLRVGAQLEGHLRNISWGEISAGIVGLIVGLLVANLLALPFADLPAVGSYIAVLLNVTLGYATGWLFIRRREDIAGMLSMMGGIWRERLRTKGRHRTGGERERIEFEGTESKILDSSVAIDGRILDVAKTGFLEGTLLLPRFVLLELQAVADSADSVRRARGRRGLDIINELQKIHALSLEIVETPLRELGAETVDVGLVALAREIGGKILTTDYNLNKIAQIQGVDVLNVNDLANALKPMLLPGESLVVDVIREGKESHQGVGYLDDGTMVVIEEGHRYVGRRVEAVVTSMLQTSAGRMIFGKMKREVA